MFNKQGLRGVIVKGVPQDKGLGVDPNMYRRRRRGRKRSKG